MLSFLFLWQNINTLFVILFLNRKYSVIEAATQQLATSIFSQEAVVEKQNPTHKNVNYSAIQNRSIPLKDLRKEKITPLQDVINLSSNLSMLEDGHLDSSTFLGVAEAYLVPDTISKIGISMDTLACVSDEVGTVESLFDNIITDDDIFASSYGLLHPKAHHLQKKTRKEYETTLQTGLIFCDTNTPSWLPESFDKPGYQLPLLQMTPDSMENKSSDFFMYNQQSDHELVLHDVAAPGGIYTPYNGKMSPKMSLPEKGYIQIQTVYECDQDIDNAGCSVVHLTNGIQDTLPDNIFKELELQPGQTNENENLDYSVFWASAKEPNNINRYRTLCLNQEENDNFLCSSW